MCDVLWKLRDVDHSRRLEAPTRFGPGNRSREKWEVLSR